MVASPPTFCAKRYSSVFCDALRPLLRERLRLVDLLLPFELPRLLDLLLPFELLRLLDLRELEVLSAITVSSLTAAALGELLGGLLRSLADAGHTLARALPDLAERLARALTELSHALSGALADVADRLAGALADVLDGLARALECVAGAAAHVLNGSPDALQELGIPIQRQRHPLEDRADVVEPRLQE